MRRKIVLTMLLCLAAALVTGATPALAASGCTCHTAVPPTGGALAAHAPLVVGVTDCTTCHKGMTVPHPELLKPALCVGMPHVDGLGTNVDGGLSRPWKPLAGVVVYMQTREPTGTVYTDAGKLKTDVRGFYVFGLGGGDSAGVWPGTAGDLSRSGGPARHHARHQRVHSCRADAYADARAQRPHSRCSETRARRLRGRQGDAYRHGGAEGPPDGAEVARPAV
jgi:hypothetical protein